MSESINVALIQADLYWEAKEKNLDFFKIKIKEIARGVDLIVLPETFPTGFTMNVEKCADRNGQILSWMKDMAINNDVYLAGSVIVAEGDFYYNRLYWVSPKGEVDFYDKRHLFRMGREDESFTPGKERKIVKLGAFRILLQVCYDLRFPVFVRNRGDYDVILYVANWPSPREYVWHILLRARAIENLSYVIAANRCGEDGEGVECCGDSVILNPKGKEKSRLEKQPGVLISSLSLKELNNFRRKFPAAKDADDFELHI